MSKQEGRHAATEAFKIAEEAPQPRRARDLVAIDHTRIDLHVVSDDGIYIGRPWLITVQCVRSRIIMGYHLTKDYPSAASVAAAMQHAFMPKIYMKERFGNYIRKPYDFYGLPARMIYDNEKVYHSRQLEACCDLLGIKVREFTPSYEPRYKGKIERFFKTMNLAVFHRLRGTVRHRPGQQQDGDKLNNPKRARISLATLDALIHKYIVDIHPYRFQKQLGEAPIDIWRRDHQARHPMVTPPEPALFEAFIGGTFTATMSNKGIAFKGGFYGSDQELADLKGALLTRRKQLFCRYSPNDLSAIWVRLKGGRFVKATAQSPHLQGATDLDVAAFLARRNDLDRASKRDIQATLGEHVEMLEKASNAKRGSRPFEPKKQAQQQDDASGKVPIESPGTVPELGEMLDASDDEVELLLARIKADSPWR